MNIGTETLNTISEYKLPRNFDIARTENLRLDNTAKYLHVCFVNKSRYRTGRDAGRDGRVVGHVGPFLHCPLSGPSIALRPGRRR